MINLTFRVGYSSQIIRIKIENMEIFYSDNKVFTKLIRLIPEDKEFLKKIKLSRNRIPSFIQELFILTKSEKEEYDNCKTEADLAEICIKDVEKKGGKIIGIEKT